MKPTLIAVSIGVAIFFVAGVALWLTGVHFSGPFAAICWADDEIDRGQRNALEGAAQRIVTTLLGPTPEAAFDAVALGSKTDLDPETFRRLASLLAAETATGSVVPQRTFLTSGWGGPANGALIPCGVAPGADMVMRRNGFEEGHVILAQTANGGARAFELWMTKENGGWKLIGIHAGASQILDFTGDDLWRQAQEQRALDHPFNAFILYNAARDLLDRGPFVQLGDTAAFREDFASYQPPDEFNRPFPLEWRLGDKSFSIQTISYLGFAGSREIGLIITWNAPSWSGVDDAERQNHELIDAFVAKYPEWSESFDAVTARALRPDSHEAWGTVYLKGFGYAPPPALPLVTEG